MAKQRPRGTTMIRAVTTAAIAASVFSTAAIDIARADEGGVSFWLPGLFGSLAATPGQPGWSWASVYYHTSVSANAGKSFTLGGKVVAGLQGQGDLTFFGPSYVFETPVLGAQATFSVLGIAGRNQASISATLTGPMGNSISGTRTDAVTGFGDIIPQFSLKWNHGVHSLMTYVTGDIPVGSYNSDRLANLGIGHGAIDGGGGYTYFNPATGNEFSMVAGMTYNFKNTDTQYQNGVDFHVDWGTSHFFTKEFQLGLVGYYFQQITGDSGSGAVLGSFQSRVAGIGPQIGYLFPVGDMQGYLNVKGYKEFASENRPEGYNIWLTFALSPKAPDPASAKPIIRKH